MWSLEVQVVCQNVVSIHRPSLISVIFANLVLLRSVTIVTFVLHL